MTIYPTIKRIFDFTISLFLIALTLPIQVILFIGSTLSTQSFGIFVQSRVGYKAKEFNLYKFKSMTDSKTNIDFQTSIGDSRITVWGKYIRRSKLDELPQLFNVLVGDMSFVGPRPDVKGYAEKLNKEQYYLHLVRPGITSPASVYFKNEEVILASKKNKKNYNDNIIWPIKAQMNLSYAEEKSIFVDLRCLFQTVGLISSKQYADN